MKGTYWPEGHVPAHEPTRVIGTRCTSCGTILTERNLSVHTDKAGVCLACRPMQPPPA